MHSSHIKPSSSGSSSSHPNSSSSRTSNSNSNDAEADPRSVPARLSAGMMPYFIPPQPQAAQRHSSDDSHSPFDPTLMTPPMSPTESSFGFESSSTIEGRFSALPPSSNPQAFTPFDQKSPWTPVTNSSVHGSLSSSTSTTPLSVSGSTTGVSPRPLSFNWEQYDGFEDDEDQDDQDSNNEAEGDTQNQRSMTSKAPYHRQFEGHHSTVRRRPYLGREPSEERYDSLRHGIGLGVSDMSEELAKARSKMSRASRAMKSMEQELEAMQMSIDQSKVSSASTRSAIEENFWRLECLALTIEKDRQDTNKRLQALGRESNEALETVTNWEVRIDWLEKRIDNTSEYVSELVLSEQECMSFIRMIIQQNQRYAIPAISRATERNIKLLAPPRLREIAHPGHRSDTVPQSYGRQPASAPPVITAQQQSQPPLQPQPSVRHIPITWLLDPIMPPKPPEILIAQDQTEDEQEDNSLTSTSAQRATIDPPAEVWRDFSRLTMAFETGQARTPFSPFQRSRSRSAGPGSLMSTSGLVNGGSISPSNSSSNNSSNRTGNSSIFKTAMARRPQVENLSPMPKILPAVVANNKLPGIKRRSQNLSHLPVHSWLQFQFNKTMTTPGALAQPGGTKKKTNVLGFKPITIFQTTV